jgi:homoserine/homoserine lactone efflux protein
VSLESWLLFCATETVLCFVPGPAVLLVISLGLTRGWAPGFAASLGILAANALYFLISGTGIAAVLLASWGLFVALKWAGAAYLIWIGLRMLLAPGAVISGLDADAPLSASDRRRGFRLGLVTQGANPKALVFFTALLPQFIDPGHALGEQVAILALSSIAIELAVLSIILAACGRVRSLARRPVVSRGLERAGGAFLVAAGAQLATLRRP